MSSYRKAGKVCVGLLCLTLMGQAASCDKIDQPVVALLEAALQRSSETRLEICFHPLRDGDSKTADTPQAEAVNEYLSASVRRWANSINGANLTIASGGNRFMAIYWDPNLSRVEKIDAIMTEFMQPQGCNVLITGQMTEKVDGSVGVRPIAIATTADDKRLVSESYTLPSRAFSCRSPQNEPRICQRDIDELISVLSRPFRSPL